MNFADQTPTHRASYGVQRGQFGGWGDAMGLWDGKPIKLDCDDHRTTTNVIKFIDRKKDYQIIEK